MRRRFLLPAAAVSLVLLIATAALWVRSYRIGAAIWLQSRSGVVVYGFSRPGYLVFAAGHADPIDIDSAWRSGLFHHSFPTESRELGKQQGDSIYSKLGLVATVTEVPIAWHDANLVPFSTTAQMIRTVYAPSWLLVLGLTYLPAKAVAELSRRQRETRRRVAGLCRACGYDLRATPGRCPECGACSAAS